MLLRLHVKGFKNLRDVNIRFGPLTCFVGANGVGKSNIFDAIQFLRSLADLDIQTAAQAVRSPLSGAFGPKDLLWGADPAQPMSFVADMLVPQEVVDDFGRRVKPATTLLRYEIAFRYTSSPVPRLELTKENLVSFKLGDAKAILGFPHSDGFRKSAVTPTRRIGPLISTKEDSDGIRLMLHQDGGSRGQPIPAGVSPRTVVGGTNAAEYPTVLAARREMASWQALHLEPSVMRAPDPFGGPSRVDEHGGHIASTLNRLMSQESTPGQTLAEAANRLAGLVPEVRSLRIDRDEVRQQMSILAGVRGCSQELGPRSLSDGTLRFLALVTMLLDSSSGDVLCMEEPENGMHPSRVPAMVSLLRDFAVDPDRTIDAENPARQVILNTHSPDVVRQLGPEEILFVDALDGPDGRSAQVCAVDVDRDTDWRSDMPRVSLRRVSDFIGGSPISPVLGQLRLPFEFGTAR
jgi:predicted ATPase